MTPAFAPSPSTQHPRASRREQALVALGRRAIAAPCWRLLAQDAAALVAETLEATHFAVAELNVETASLIVRWTQRERLTSSADAMEPHVVPARGDRSLAGHALAVAQPVVCRDVATDLRFADASLRDLRIASALAMPLHMAGQQYGALVVGDLLPREFTQEEIQFCESIAHLLSTSIAHAEARQNLATERRRYAALLNTSATLVLHLAAGGRVEQMNRAARQLTGFSLDDLAQRTFWNTLLVADEVPAFRAAFESCGDDGAGRSVETWIVTRDGERRRIAWTLAKIVDSIEANGTTSGETEATIIASGIDITRQHELEQSLRDAGNNIAPPPSATGATSTTESAPRPFAPMPTPPEAERRTRTRRAFPYMQRIAPFVNGRVPPASEFRTVRCRDIAAAGFSFFAPQPPEFQDLIVSLGTEDSPTYLTARVMHATIVEREGKSMYIVGCRYLGREGAAMSSEQ